MPPASAGGGPDIKLMPCAFEPTITQVAEGTEVTFINGSDFTHLITGANQAWGSPDVEVQPEASVSYTFDTAGIYPYACALHPGMSGAIVVGDVGDALAAGSTGASNAGGSTGASTQEESSTSGGSSTAATSATAEAPASTALPLIVAGLGAGLVAGAAAAWLAIRRRDPGGRSLVHVD
jgi:hypothetical protein